MRNLRCFVFEIAEAGHCRNFFQQISEIQVRGSIVNWIASKDEE